MLITKTGPLLFPQRLVTLMSINDIDVCMIYKEADNLSSKYMEGKTTI